MQPYYVIVKPTRGLAAAAAASNHGVLPCRAAGDGWTGTSQSASITLGRHRRLVNSFMTRIRRFPFGRSTVT